MISRALNKKADRLDRVFRALGDRTRRAMLARLADGPANITELAAPFDMTLPGASKHVKVLERAGLIARKLDGTVHRCSLAPGPLEEIADWVDHYRSFWDQSLDALSAYVEGGRDR